MAPTTLPAVASSADADDCSRSGGGGGGSGGSVRERKRKATSSPADSEDSTETTRSSTRSTVASSGTGGSRLTSPPDAGLKECSSSSSSDHQQNVRVVARLRPLSAKELSENSAEAITTTNSPNGTGIILVDKSRRFEYDAVFHPKAAQAEVYEQTAGDSVQCSLFKGFNVTILAYGQTGSGKTHTMGTACAVEPSSNNKKDSTDEQQQLIAPSESDGIIPRAVYDLFRTRASLPNGKSRVKVELSYLEIYNEEARDLLFSGNPAKAPDLNIRDSKEEGVVVRNLSRHEVECPADVANLMAEASGRRVTASTQMNAVSSRSHAVCTLYVSIEPDDNEEDDISEEIRAKLTLVDLAGSERIKRTGAEGARMKEGISINKGLFVLGQVVSALSEIGQQKKKESSKSSSSQTHIPYRDSKLTRLLQDSLGGNSKTIMVACVSPADSNIEESVNTLRYATRARNIKNSAVRNVTTKAISPAEATALRREIQLLKIQLLQAQMANAASTGNPVSTSMSTLVPSVSGTVPDTTSLEGINVEKLEIASRLRVQNTSLKVKVSQMEQRNIECAEDALTSSFKADKYRRRFECLVAALTAKGIEIPQEAKADASPRAEESLAVQLRRQLAELKEEPRDSQTDAEVARATAAAIVAGEGDPLSAEEQLALAGQEANEISNVNVDNDVSGNDDDRSSLSAELLAVDSDIDRKEAMAEKMNKERECMDALKSHFEEAAQRLQEEVGVLSSEREMLLKKVGSDGPMVGKKRNASEVMSEDSLEHKKMKKRIIELEERIRGLKKKSAEHSKTLRMRDAAEKKCSQLATEIQQDKKRKAELQRQLKEAAMQRRSDKKAAQLQASRMLRDSNKIKAELQKVKDKAAKQAAVLRRKAAEAVSKQRMLEEKQKKRNNAAAMRGARTSSTSVGLQRKEELTKWLEKELHCSMTLKDIQDQIQEQNDMIEEAMSKKHFITRQSELQSLEMEIASRKSIIDQLEKNVDELYKSILGSSAEARAASTVSGPSSFVDTSTWQGLTRQELRLIGNSAFNRLVEASKEIRDLRSQKDGVLKTAVQRAVAEEQRKAEEILMKLKIDHSDQMMTLLESTKDSVQHRLRQDLTAGGIGEDGLDDEAKAAIDVMLSSYLSGCEKVSKNVKSELDDVKEKHEGMKSFVNSVVMTMVSKNETSALVKSTKKKKSAAKKASPDIDDDDFDLFEEEEDDAGALEDSDSDWAPDTPAPKRRRNGAVFGKKKQAKREYDALSSDDENLAGENISQPDESDKTFESMTVAELKEALKKVGKTVGGKKCDLIKRLRQSQFTPAEQKPTPSPAVASKENGISTPPIVGRNRKVPLGGNSSTTESSSSSSNGGRGFKGTPANAGAGTSGSRTRPPRSLKRQRQQSAPPILTESAKKMRRTATSTSRREAMAAAMASVAKAAESLHQE